MASNQRDENLLGKKLMSVWSVPSPNVGDVVGLVEANRLLSPDATSLACAAAEAMKMGCKYVNNNPVNQIENDSSQSLPFLLGFGPMNEDLMKHALRCSKKATVNLMCKI